MICRWRGWKWEILETVLLTNIKDEHGQLLCDHLWLNKTKGISKFLLQEGDELKFESRVARYYKGYLGRSEEVFKPIRDFKLFHILQNFN